ncbi:transmembrane CLPTM1 family protein [Reticulomyxa filosa]|uniref:Transmembrane CLPTM1 family protein n=1 Tax=Reticulomyxa filosa TaxID=46433 RepID=X6LSV8_RETFI|nr:transmembrane CLPTM1 family protein [Reticulomyxa filosa]|eukprot:ETO04202.1 transmembrane CLPTM1 family protein [Reticulomyxa filosa]
MCCSDKKKRDHTFLYYNKKKMGLISNILTAIPILYLLYMSYTMSVTLYSLWNPDLCQPNETTNGNNVCFCPSFKNASLVLDLYLSNDSSMSIRGLSDLTDPRSTVLLHSTDISMETSWDQQLKKSQTINGWDYNLQRNGSVLYVYVVGYLNMGKEAQRLDTRKKRNIKNMFAMERIPLLYASEPQAETYNLWKETENTSTCDKTQTQMNANVTSRKEYWKVPFWKPNITIYYLTDFTCFRIDQQTQNKIVDMWHVQYDPIVYSFLLTSLHKWSVQLMNKYGDLMAPNSSINENEKELFDLAKLPLQITISPISLGFFRLYLMMDNSFHALMSSWYELKETDIDQIKSLFVDTSPILILSTFVVAILHSIFSILALKSDISYWNDNENNNQNLHGISVNSILFECISSFVILLYLIDSQQTNKIIITLMILECCTSLWKIYKIYQIRKTQISRQQQSDANGNVSPASNISNSTESLDKKATRFLLLILIPVIIGYGCYSFIYEKHKSIISFLINVSASCVYGLGFIHLTPQLFINYELKSVDSLPWKVLIYRFFNTFVDDLFSFVIEMPFLHRLACFRDDVVFIVFLIQWYKYGSKDKSHNDNKKND